MITRLSLTDVLPLTCARTGTCCHGKMVRLNPWELARLGDAKNMSAREFRDRYCEHGGIILRFDGAPGWNNQAACSQYVPGSGCSVHPGRPLACRLYPLGRHQQGEQLYYMFQGREFPCMEGCPEVDALPRLSVAEYVAGQATHDCEAAQDAYLEVMQDLADSAFAFLLETGLVQSGDKRTLRLWRKMGAEEPAQLAKRLGSAWLDRLMLPDFSVNLDDPLAFIERHRERLQAQIQEACGASRTMDEFRAASVLLMGLALHLGRGLGADPAGLAERWIGAAKRHGAQE
jgi:uncharacterized protein